MPAKKKLEGKAKAGSIPGDTGSVATATMVRRQMPPRACKSKSQSAARPSLSPSRLAKKPSLTPTTASQAPSPTIAKSRPTGLETIFERPGNEDDGPTSSHAVAFGECQRRVLALGTGEKKRTLSQKSCLKVRNTLGERSTRHMMTLRASRTTLDSVMLGGSDDEGESVGVAPAVAPVAAPEVVPAGGNAGTNQPAPFVLRTSRRLKSLPPF
ncbi:protein tantalus-like isoform X2 [Drosophila miranda]|uniref:protein tantalus-like isoform X2 n=1 Tax=Drosophila miranda TaxID=7229 RepID=UPI00143F448C|nr:protein tantalus-like isoform X2 [Drosophila miranda]